MMKLKQTDHIFQEYREAYPPLLTFEQATEIADCPMGTIYDWSSRGKFDSFKIRCGRSCRLFRDDFVRWFIERPD